MINMTQHEQWAAAQVENFPFSWKKRLLSNWREKSHPAATLPAGQGLVTNVIQTANSELREIVETLSNIRLPLDASNADICDRAREFATHCFDMPSGKACNVTEARAAMSDYVRTLGIEPPNDEIEDRPAIARMTHELWWRRALRTLHAKSVEGAAIKLGYVNRQRDIYVSNESVERCQQQNKRNQAMMEKTILRNELDQEFTLAELASRGTANQVIRRGELMTRIAGFEVIARECSHGGLFLTLTCPSRMHQWNSAGGDKVYKNAKYDKDGNPKLAQKYLCKVWSRIRAALARAGTPVYGFRIAEPHHDACPHWHMLFFHAPEHAEKIIEVFKHHALKDSPDEAGAKEHRVKVEVIDFARGSAAGYPRYFCRAIRI